jgi:glycosyltransferase involved in cell wall biosynthesis
LSKELVKRGHTVSVVTLNILSYSLPAREYVDGVNIIRISGMFQKLGILYGGSNVRPNLPIKDIVLKKQLADIIEELQPVVIVCHSNFLYSVRSLAAKLEIPLIVTLHDYGFICPIGNLLFKHESPCSKQYSVKCLKCVISTSGIIKAILGCLLFRVNRPIIGSVDRYIAVSQAVKEIYLGATRMPVEKINVIYNFYNLEEKQPLPFKCMEQFPERFILYVGAFSSQKGVNVLLDAYKSIRDRISSDIKLVMIVASLGAEVSVREEGILVMVDQPRSVVMDAWRRCLFGVVPSIWSEPFGLVALEAMAEEKALIASNIGGLKEIVVDNETGLLVPPGNVNELAHAILFLVEHPEVARDLGKKGCTRLLECFSRDVALEKYETVFRELVVESR